MGLRTCLFAAAWLGSSQLLQGAVVFEFADGGLLDDHGAGDTAVMPADSESGIVGTITTLGVTGGTLPGRLNETSKRLGIVGASSTNQFDLGESWTFSWDVDSRLDFINFNAFSKTESFSVQSSAWIDRAFEFAVPQLTFDSLSGTLTFADFEGDAFDLAQSVSGDSLQVDANVPYTFASAVGAASVETMAFSLPAASGPTSVPEPATLGAIAFAVGAVLRRQRQRRASSQAGRAGDLSRRRALNP